MTDANRRFRRLTHEQALRALYIDFEGRKDEAPVLLGIHRRGRGARPFVHWLVLDAAFGSLGAPVATLHEAVSNVVVRAEHGDRRIVAWSEHELGIVRGLADVDPELVARFEARYANARAVAERWRNKVHGGSKPAVGRLADYLPLAGVHLPADAVGGEVGETILRLRGRLDRGLPPTTDQARRWRALLEHNRADCAGMRKVCLLAAREMGAADAPGASNTPA